MNRAQQFRRSALMAGLLSALCACASLNSLRGIDSDSCVDDPCLTQPEDPSRLLRHAEQVSRMSEPARRREYAQAERAFARDTGAFNRLRLALLLTLPDTAFQCDSCARNLLRDYLQQDGNDHAWRDVATLLLRSTEQRLALQQELETERKQHQQARQQLEKLKAIEQRINERDRAAAAKPDATP